MEIKLRLFAAYQMFVSWLMAPYYLVIDFLPAKPCPNIKDDVLKLSITRLAADIRNGKLKSARVVRAYIARIEEVNPLLNAVTDQRFADAIREAEDVDKFVESKSKAVELIERDTPLLGVPITVKESCQVAGLAFTVGSLPRVGVKGTTNGEAVKQATNAGAIVLCVTNTPELCLSWEANNLVTGITRNPYDYYRTSGGSSGGEGALVGAAASPGGIGSDIAGSIRLPALYNGVFGHKPTPGYVSLEGHYPREPSFDNFLQIGPIVRYAEDLPLMMRVLTSYNIDKLRLDLPVALENLNVFYQENAGFSLVDVSVDEDIVSAMKRAVDTFSQMGCKTTKTKIKLLPDAVEIGASVMLDIKGIPNLIATSKRKRESHHNLLLEVIKSNFNLSEFSYAGLLFTFLFKNKFLISDGRIENYKKLAMELKTYFSEMLGDNGVFFYPTFPIPAPHHNETFNKTAGVMYSLIFNALGMPSTNVPMGLGRKNLPVGFQVVAGPHQDRLCFAVAQALEKQFGGWVPPPS